MTSSAVSVLSVPEASVHDQKQSAQLMGHLHFHIVLIRRAPRERPQGRVTRRGLSDIRTLDTQLHQTQRKHATEKNDPAETDQNT